MSTQPNIHDQQLENPADIDRTKPSKSRFLFILLFFSLFIFSWAGCYNLYEHKFQKNDDVEAPKSSLYSPEYK